MATRSTTVEVAEVVVADPEPDRGGATGRPRCPPAVLYDAPRIGCTTPRVNGDLDRPCHVDPPNGCGLVPQRPRIAITRIGELDRIAGIGTARRVRCVVQAIRAIPGDVVARQSGGRGPTAEQQAVLERLQAEPAHGQGIPPCKPLTSPLGAWPTAFHRLPRHATSDAIAAPETDDPTAGLR